jgi:hypothetical protein
MCLKEVLYFSKKDFLKIKNKHYKYKKSYFLVKNIFFSKNPKQTGIILQHISFSIVYDPGGSTGKSSSVRLIIVSIVFASLRSITPGPK